MSKRSYKPKNKQKYMTNFYALFIIVNVVILVVILCL